MNEEEINDLVQLYKQFYRKEYGRDPDLNKFRDSFGFASMLHDYNIVECKEIIEYYFKTGGEHSTRRLFENYDGLRQAKERSDKDHDKIGKLLKETEQRVKQWEEKHSS